MQVFATSPAAVYTGVGNAFTRISSTEGMRALWRGVSSVIMGAGPAHAVHFGAYELVKEFAGGNVEGASNQWIATCTCAPSSLARNMTDAPRRKFPCNSGIGSCPHSPRRCLSDNCQ